MFASTTRTINVMFIDNVGILFISTFEFVMSIKGNLFMSRCNGSNDYRNKKKYFKILMKIFDVQM